MILITRPKEQSKDLKLTLVAKGYKNFQESLYSIEYLNRKVPYDKDSYYIFSSIHSVKSLVKNKQIYKFINANIFAIGKKVKQELINSGCKKILATSIDSKTLVVILNSLKFNEVKLVYLCSNVVNSDFFNDAKKYKLSVKKKIIYKTQPIKKFTKKLIYYLSSNRILGITLYSKLSAETLLILLKKYKILSNFKETPMYCISDRVAKPLRQKKFKHIYVASKPNQKSLIVSIKKSHFV